MFANDQPYHNIKDNSVGSYDDIADPLCSTSDF